MIQTIISLTNSLHYNKKRSSHF